MHKHRGALNELSRLLNAHLKAHQLIGSRQFYPKIAHNYLFFNTIFIVGCACD